jgi:hypothetical protein
MRLINLMLNHEGKSNSTEQGRGGAGAMNPTETGTLPEDG